MTTETEILRREIAERVEAYYESAFRPRAFAPGETPVPVSGKVFDAAELQHLVDSALDFWLTSGRFANGFENEVRRIHRSQARPTGQFRLLRQPARRQRPDLPRLGKRRLKPGDEVITVAAGFPTTVNPIIQNHLVPVFVDVVVADLQHRCGCDGSRARAKRPGRSYWRIHSEIPSMSRRVARFCEEHGLWLIEDCCDAVGSAMPAA